MIKNTKEKIGSLQCVIARDTKNTSPKACVILCHGFGAPSTDLVSLAEAFVDAEELLQDCVFVFPAAPIELDPLFDARAWWMIDMEKLQRMMMDGDTRELKSSSPKELPELRAELSQVIEHCKSAYDLPAAKIVIGGFSQGSMLCTDVALHYPEPLGGLIVWSGSMINETIWQEKMKSQARLRIVQSHGNIDPILPMQCAEDLRDALVEAGHDVQFHRFQGEHSIPLEAVTLAAKLILQTYESAPKV